MRRRSSITSIDSPRPGSEAYEAGCDFPLSESQESVKSHLSRSGFSDTFFDALNISDGSQEQETGTAASTDPSSPQAKQAQIPSSPQAKQAQAPTRTMTLSEGSELAKSIGVVCTLSRPSTNKRQKEIKPFALQKTFYAFPKTITEEQKEKIKVRIEKDIVDFKVQKYNVSIERFGLPFAVDEICCVSEGYNLTPKIYKAVLPDKPEPAPAKKDKKRKRGCKDESESEESDEDAELEEKYGITCADISDTVCLTDIKSKMVAAASSSSRQAHAASSSSRQAHAASSSSRQASSSSSRQAHAASSSSSAVTAATTATSAAASDTVARKTRSKKQK